MWDELSRTRTLTDLDGRRWEVRAHATGRYSATGAHPHPGEGEDGPWFFAGGEWARFRPRKLGEPAWTPEQLRDVSEETLRALLSEAGPWPSWTDGSND